jgi:hypothetical protein
MNPVEIIQKVLNDDSRFKLDGLALEKLPPNEEAANLLVDAYRHGKVKPWLTAYLLGCIGHVAGYDTAREILLAHPGSSAEVHAGIALAQIKGADAECDLCEILLEQDHARVRLGAAHGLSQLGQRRFISVFVEAYRKRGLLPRHALAWHIAKCRPDDEILLDLLNSPDIRSRKLGCAVVNALLDGGFMPPGRAVAKRVFQLLGSDTLPASGGSRYEKLRKWAAAARPRESVWKQIFRRRK